MASGALKGGITRSGVSGSYTYSAIAGRENLPVNLVSFYDALRFANWLHNGQGAGDTETGAYTLLGGTATPSNGATVARNPGAAVFLASEDEWYKAAYYDGLSASYFDYPAGTNSATVCATPTATANRANCGNVVADLTAAGSYPGSPSPFGTFDQGGNAMEWSEGTITGSPGTRAVRGGAWNGSGSLAASVQLGISGSTGSNNLGFRVAPEPARVWLVAAGAALIAGLARWRR